MEEEHIISGIRIPANTMLIVSPIHRQQLLAVVVDPNVMHLCIREPKSSLSTFLLACLKFWPKLAYELGLWIVFAGGKAVMVLYL